MVLVAMEKSYSAEPQKNAVVKIANGLAELSFGHLEIRQCAETNLMGLKFEGLCLMFPNML